MARSYAKLHVGAWADDGWVALDPIAKLVYLFLLSQPKMRSCGVLDMQPRRWAPRIGLTADELDDALERLEARQFILIDQDTDELAVRTFVKHDAGDTKNWKVWIGVWSSLDAVESDMLRDYVADNMPDAAYEPKAKPSRPRSQSIGNRSPIDHQSGRENRGAIDSQSDTQSIGSGKSVTTSDSVAATTTVADPPNDPPTRKTTTARAGVVVDAISIIAEQELADHERRRGDIERPGAFLAAIRRRLTSELTGPLTALAHANPDATPARLVELHHGAGQPLLPANAPPRPSVHANCPPPCDGHGNHIHDDGVTPNACPGTTERTPA